MTTTQICMEVQTAISDYQKGTYPGMMIEMDELKKKYRQQGKTDAVLRDCVKGGHQWCLSKASINAAVIALRQFNFSGMYGSFEDVFDDVKNLIGHIPGVCGRLTLYDTARRIGHLLDMPVYPNNYVYVARGARIGAKYVLGIKRMKGNVFRLPISDFTNLFPGISSMEIEDILCIYFHEGKFKNGIVKVPSAKGCGNKKPRHKCGR